MVEHYISLATKAMFVWSRFRRGICIDHNSASQLGHPQLFPPRRRLCMGRFPRCGFELPEFYCIYCRHRCHGSIGGNDPR